MNGVTHLELDDSDSEFVEVDPTGRYGRVYPLSLNLWLSFSSFPASVWWYFFLYLLQYNEILGKGASKTVYAYKLILFLYVYDDDTLFFISLNLKSFWLFQFCASADFLWIWASLCFFFWVCRNGYLIDLSFFPPTFIYFSFGGLASQLMQI